MSTVVGKKDPWPEEHFSPSLSRGSLYKKRQNEKAKKLEKKIKRMERKKAKRGW